MSRPQPGFRFAALLLIAAGLLLADRPASPLAAAQAGDRTAPHWSDATQRVVLDNGLTVLMLQRGELPIVSVQALYRFGSRNEWPGITGGAHYVEHMAFRATEGIGKQDLTNQILRWGGRWNGYTSYDQTVYGSHAPSRYLEWLIYLERERMQRVIFSPEEVDLERTSVIAELRQYENSPAYTLTAHRLRRAALVAHPYGSPIMGWISDLEGVSGAELERFYREHYAPNNLILAIVGRFDPVEALALVKKHFDGVPGNGRPTAIRTIEPEQRGLRRIVHRGPGSTKHLELMLHAPAASDEGFATLLVIDGLLAGGNGPGSSSVRPGGRLYRALVQPGLAAGVSTRIEASEYPGLYSISVSAPADADLQRIEEALGAALDDLARAVPADEVRRAGGQVRAALIYGADSNRANANLLTVYEQLESYRLLAQLPARLAAVTPAHVERFAVARLGETRRTIGWFLPDGRPPSTRTTAGGTPAEAERSAPPAPDRRLAGLVRPPAPDLDVPQLPAPTRRTLPNGLTTLLLPMPGEAVHLRVRIAAGAVHDPAGREGTAVLAARLLATGTETRSREELLAAFADRNVRLSQSAFDTSDPFGNRHFVELRATLLRQDLPDVLGLVADMMRHPAFPESSLASARQALRAELAARDDDSRWRARRAIFERLFPPHHSYGRAVDGTPETHARIRRDDLVVFHQRLFRPDRVVVAIAGGVEPDAALGTVQGVFGDWRRPSATVAEPPAALRAVAGEAARVHVPMPHKAQASIVAGLPGVRRDDRAYPALAALNYLLGETGYAGRLGETLVDTGLAYAVYASVLADRGPGPILITTDAVDSEEAARRILATLEGFARQGVTEAELREAQGFLLGRLLFRFESAEAATATLAELAYFGDTADLQRFARQVLGLTVKDLNTAANRFYDPSRAVVVIAGR